MALLDQETTYYDGSSMSSGPIPEGKYYAHIVEVTKKFTDKVVKSRDDQGATHLCDLLEVTYQIAEGEFESRNVWSNAIWIFKDPKDGVNGSVVSGNIVIGNGGKKSVKALPIDVDNAHILGKPVLIEVKHRKYQNKDGEDKIAANEAGIYAWENGKEVQVDDDDLPF